MLVFGISALDLNSGDSARRGIFFFKKIGGVRTLGDIQLIQLASKNVEEEKEGFEGGRLVMKRDQSCLVARVSRLVLGKSEAGGFVKGGRVGG